MLGKKEISIKEKSLMSKCYQAASLRPNLAGLSGLFIGRIIGDQARFVIQVGARRLAAAAPLPHPLAVAPAVGTEQGDLLSAQSPQSANMGSTSSSSSYSAPMARQPKATTANSENRAAE